MKDDGLFQILEVNDISQRISSRRRSTSRSVSRQAKRGKPLRHSQQVQLLLEQSQLADSSDVDSLPSTDDGSQAEAADSAAQFAGNCHDNDCINTESTLEAYKALLQFKRERRCPMVMYIEGKAACFAVSTPVFKRTGMVVQV